MKVFSDIINDLYDFKDRLTDEKLKKEIEDIIKVNNNGKNKIERYSNLVELWELRSKDSKNYIILKPVLKEGNKITYSVVNGGYCVYQDKEKNEITMWPPKVVEHVYHCTGPKVTHVAYYLGDIRQYEGENGFPSYEKTLDIYEKTKEIVGKNLIPLHNCPTPRDYEPTF